MDSAHPDVLDISRLVGNLKKPNNQHVTTRATTKEERPAKTRNRNDFKRTIQTNEKLKEINPKPQHIRT